MPCACIPFPTMLEHWCIRWNTLRVWIFPVFSTDWTTCVTSSPVLNGLPKLAWLLKEHFASPLRQCTRWSIIATLPTNLLKLVLKKSVLKTWRALDNQLCLANSLKPLKTNILKLSSSITDILAPDCLWLLSLKFVTMVPTSLILPSNHYLGVRCIQTLSRCKACWRTKASMFLKSIWALTWRLAHWHKSL